MIWLAMEGNQLPYLTAQVGLSSDSFWLKEIMNLEVVNTLRCILEVISLPEKDALHEQSLLFDLFWKMRNASTRLTPTRKAYWLDDVKDYLDLHATEHIRIEDAARLVGIHRSHLFASFRKNSASRHSSIAENKAHERNKPTEGDSFIRDGNRFISRISGALFIYPLVYQILRHVT